MPRQPVADSLVAILDYEQNVVGTGFCVGKGLILTSADTIQRTGIKPGGHIRLQGYLPPNRNPTIVAQILSQYWAPDEDIALLQVAEQQSDWSGIGPHKLVHLPEKDLLDHPVYALMPDFSGKSEPLGLSGFLYKAPNAFPVFGFKTPDQERLQYFIGSPVVDEASEQLIGMIAKIGDEYRVIPAETIFRVCPILREDPGASTPAPEASTVPPDKSPAAEAAAAEAPARRILLSTRGKTVIEAFDSKPSPAGDLWNLEVDAFVLPVGTRGALGGQTARTFLKYIGEEHKELFQALLQESLKSLTPPYLAPETPLLIDMRGKFPASLPPYLIAASAYRHSRSATNKTQQSEQSNLAESTPESETISADNAAAATAAILRLAATNNLGRVVIPLLGAGSGSLDPVQVAGQMLLAAQKTLEELGETPLRQITLAMRSAEAFAALQAAAETPAEPTPPPAPHAPPPTLWQPQKAVNDNDHGRDLLNVREEAAALAKTLLLKETQPPLAVGVIGGWGSGKSFAMHLMREEMLKIRCQAVKHTDRYPYVGHVYLINFDAWTYAKSNLWSSLMQTIFVELNHQLEYEKSKQLGCGRHQEALIRGMYGHVAPVAMQEALWAEMQARKAEELKKLKAKEEETARKRAELEAARLRLHQQVDAEIEYEAQNAAWQPLRDVLKGGLIEDFWKWLCEALDMPFEKKSEPAERALVRSRQVELLAFLFFLLAVNLLPQLYAALQPFQGLVSAGSLVALVLRTFDQWKKQVGEEREKLKKERPTRIERALAEDQAVLLKEIQNLPEHSEEQKDAIQKLAAGGSGGEDDSQNIAALERQLKELETQVEKQRRLAGITADYTSLLDLCAKRLDQAEYEKQLGLMHQVKRDLEEMTAALTVSSQEVKQDLEKLFPRGAARIVLFIDDLDRCPPDRVVEVLEATQLLLKTELFVVVLAMDVRYVTRALEKTYDRILCRQGDPSGLDYIEKIIQIPYQIRPMTQSAVPQYIRALMMEAESRPGTTQGTGQAPKEPPSDGQVPTGTPVIPPETGLPQPSSTPPLPAERPATPLSQPAELPAGRPAGDASPEETGGEDTEDDSPATIASFSENEYSFVVLCCQYLPTMTPRAAKRLVNVYKLLKIYWASSAWQRQPQPAVEQAMVLLLALACAYPDAMREAFNELLLLVRGQRIAAAKENTDRAFLGFFTQSHLPALSEMAQREWKSLSGDITRLSQAKEFKEFGQELSSLELHHMEPERIQLVRSFSFIGDLGYERGEGPFEKSEG